jgi:NDP-sugar pyrophosphorylase family protein
VGDGSVAGNSCEFKNCVLHAKANVPHFAYVGDSLLGYKAHLGAGVKISNVKLTWTTVSVKGPQGPIDTGLIKFGAVLGDHTDIGCNSVLNPGTMIGSHSIVYPNSSWRGILPPKHIAKLRQSFETVERKD